MIINFKDNSHLHICKLDPENDYDYTFSYHNKDMFNGLKNDSGYYQNRDFDVTYSYNDIFIKYIHKGGSFKIQDIIDIFNLFDKTDDYVYLDTGMDELDSEEIGIDFESIPILEVENIDKITFQNDWEYEALK